ncbi:MAG: hypothetical protein KME46_29785 [Brasilonema angustatum HA4187-MV1]|jgi:hypothetical protein|nr:hypothetical protein [Brasilonema angustatum HA4187-MV1]
MSVDKFLNSLDIFQTDADEEYVHVKTTAATIISLGLLFFPPSALRWDGSIRSPFDKTSLSETEEVRLYPNAVLNRSIRIMSAVLGLSLAGYSGLLDHKHLSTASIRRKKKEAKSIIEDERMNAQIIEYIPAEKQIEAPPSKQLTPAAQQAIALLMSAKRKEQAGREEDLEALAASKFKVTAKSANVDEGMKARNIAVNKAIEMVNNPVEGQDKWVNFRDIGRNILNGMRITEKSLLIASGTGTGKTTTELDLLEGLMNNYPNTTFYALLQKNDQLTGVKEENRQVFNNLLLTDYLNQGDSDEEEEPGIVLEHILRPLFQVYREFAHRKELPPEERDRLKETSPIRLVLGDWFATFQELKRLNKKDFGHVMSMIRQIITVGRDSGVALIVDSQSAALASLGLAEDASIRESLDIYSQGFVRTVGGREKGEVRTMLQVIGNNSLVSKEDRPGIMAAYLLLTNAIGDNSVTSPIIFTTVGSVPSIGIVPDLSNKTVREVGKTRGSSFNKQVNELAQSIAQELTKAPETNKGSNNVLDDLDLSDNAIKMMEAIDKMSRKMGGEPLKPWAVARIAHVYGADRNDAIQELKEANLIIINSEGNLTMN